MPVCSLGARSLCRGPISPQAPFLFPHKATKVPGSGTMSQGKAAKSGLVRGSPHNPSP